MPRLLLVELAFSLPLQQVQKVELALAEQLHLADQVRDLAQKRMDQTEEEDLEAEAGNF